MVGMNALPTIECLSLQESIDHARLKWAEANIRNDETKLQFAKRIGVSYRTILRWMRPEKRPSDYALD